MYMKIRIYSAIYLNGDVCVVCDIFTCDVHESCSISTWIYRCIMLYIHAKIYMKLYMYNVIYLHADIHVLCKIFTWRDTSIINYILYLHEAICVSCILYITRYVLDMIYPNTWYKICDVVCRHVPQGTKRIYIDYSRFLTWRYTCLM